MRLKKIMNLQLTKSHKAYFDTARAVSQLSDFPRVRIGCVAVYRHRIISSGCNTQRTAPIQKKYNQLRFSEETQHSCHAEIACLKSLIGRKDIDFKDVSLYIYRTLADGSTGMCRPCPSCMALIRELKIRHIYFTTEDSYVYEELIY